MLILKVMRNFLCLKSARIFDRGKGDPRMIGELLKGERVVLLDVGVRGGVHSRWQRVQGLIDIVGFEADESECARLNEEAKCSSVNVRYLPFALGKNRERGVKFYICKSPGNSSLYEPNRKFIEDFPYSEEMTAVASAQVDLTTLDDVCRIEELRPDCLKIDTQGSELDILLGGLNILNRSKFVELEVEFNSQYLNQPIFSDVDKFMRQNDFVLLGLRRSSWRRAARFPKNRTPFGGQIMHGDAIYYKGTLLTQPEAWSFVDLLKFLLILSAYRQDDFVVYLLSSPHRALVALCEGERLALARELTNESKWFVNAVAKLLPLIVDHTVLRGIVDRFKNPGETDWHDPDYF